MRPAAPRFLLLVALAALPAACSQPVPAAPPRGPSSSPGPADASSAAGSRGAQPRGKASATKAPPRRPAPVPPPGGPPPEELAGEPQPRGGRAPQASAAGEYLRRLRAEPQEAAAAYRELWEAPAGLIPDLILEVDSQEPTSLREIAVLVLDEERFMGLGKDGKPVYEIRGMGGADYDDIVAGKARSGHGLKVILRSFRQPFPMGVVLRAALINRFRSTRFPPGDDRSNPVGWWQQFYGRVAAEL